MVLPQAPSGKIPISRYLLLWEIVPQVLPTGRYGVTTTYNESRQKRVVIRQNRSLERYISLSSDFHGFLETCFLYCFTMMNKSASPNIVTSLATSDFLL
jgi:hypothetical protein